MKNSTRSFLIFVALVASTTFAQAQYGSVRFGASSITVYESDGVVNIPVNTFGGSVNSASSIFVSSTNSAVDNPPTTAVLYLDYTTNSSFTLGPGGRGLGIGSVSGVQGTTQYVPITLVDNTNVQSSRVIVMEFWGTSSLVVAPTTCTVTILDDDSLVTLNTLDPDAYENGKKPGSFQVWRYGDTSDALTVNFTKSGSATYTTDYTLSGPSITSGSVTIPAGESSAIIKVVPVDDSITETNETVKLALAGGYYKTNSLSSGTVTITDNDATVNIAATDSTSSESGDSGFFTVTRTADTALPLTIKYVVSGSASNGVDFAYISNSVVIPSGSVSATITIAPLYDLLVEGTESVTLTLVTNGYSLGTVTNATVNISDFDDNSREVPVIGGGLASNARYGRFFRGTGAYPMYHSLVVPVDFQQGIPLDNSGGNAATLFPGIGWSDALFHFNFTNTAAPIAFSNPIAAFGSRVGGSPLYYGQPYTFGIYAGDPKPTATNANAYTNALRIKVYSQSSFSLVATTNFTIPNISDTNEWAAFLTNGYSKTLTAYGLTTTLSFNNSGDTWDTSSSTPNNFDVAYHLTHSAAQTSTNYIYLVELAGGTSQGWMVTSNGNRAWSPLYTIEFDKRPAWRSLLLQTPQFFTEPIPPGYMGRSAEELLTNNPPVTNLVSVPNPIASYTNLDQSPELRTNAILDQFVTDMGKDPLLLANYVLNEIELTDAIDYNDSGALSQTEINLSGVNRGALGTFQEGQGSPTEQCGLLVYLLRKAGYPAIYLFPPRNGLKIIDSRLSKLLRTQIRRPVDEDGNVITTNQFIPVNYPWVAVYIGTNWVHIFPWLKDTEVEEGANLYDYMPAQYDNAFKWAKAYTFGDTNLLSLNPEDDSPLIIYSKFIEKTLNENAPGVSMDRVGVKAWDRRHYYSRWSDFPTPTSLTNSNIAVESLGSSSITNVSPALTNIFNTVSVEISSVEAPTKKVSSGDLRLAEMHNRRLVAWHTKVATNNHTLTLSLAPFRPSITAKKAFTSVQMTNAANTNILCALTNSVSLASTNDQLKMTLVYKRDRSLSGSYTAPYLGFSASLSVTNIGYLRKGDLATICLDVGRVTRKMLDQHAEEVWAMENAKVAGSTDEYQGSVAYLMGMSYYEKADRFTSLAARLHKAQPIANFASGLSMLRAKRDASDELPNGDITLVQPVVDMFFKEVVAIGNQTVHLESGDSGYGPHANVFELAITAASALEHNIINRFFKQSDAVSTVRLLQMAQNTTNGIIFLNRFNYTNEGNKVYPAGSTNKLKDTDPSIWNIITNTFTAAYESNNVQVFITPGKLSNATRSFTGMGALVFSPSRYYALIGDGLNGGYGPVLEDTTLASSNLTNSSVTMDRDNSVAFDSSPFVSDNSVVTSRAVSSVDAVDFANSLNPGTTINDAKTTELDSGKDILNMTSNLREVQQEFIFDVGAMDKGSKNNGWEWLKDPVNAVTGEFYIDTVDLRLNGPMPLEIRRNYGSQNVFNNDFGYGWKLNYMPFLTVSTDSTNILLYAAEPDGSVLAYRRQTNASGTYTSIWIPTAKDNPRLQNVAGSTHNLYNTSATRTTNGTVVTYTLRAPDGSVRSYLVHTNFQLSTSIKRQRPYLDTWQDAQGNYFKFSYGTNSADLDFGKVRRVESSNGNFIGFRYDVYGHIIEAFTGDGRRLVYEYDDFGDLVRVQAPDASEIKYDYRHEVLTTNSTRQIYSTHLLSYEQKPDGRLLQNDYDKERRVINQYATVGTDFRLIRNASFSYSNNFAFKTSLTNLVQGYTLITDYLTNVSRYEYTNSLITKSIDPLLRTNANEWYADTETNAPAYPRSLKRTIDPRGLTNDYQYDLQGNVTNVSATGDLTGDGTNRTATTVSSYNTNRLVTNIVDQLGNKRIYTYTNSFYPFLPTSEEHYASNNALISSTLFENYNVTNAIVTNNYSGSYGLLRRQIRAFGSSDAATNEWAHDPHGFIIQQIQYTGTADPAVTNFFFHNLRGELVEKTDAAGRGTEFSYDARGNIEWKEVFDENGSTVARSSFYYNQNGQLTWSDGPRFGPEDYTWRDYDGAGNVIEEDRYRSRAKLDGTGVELETGDALFATMFFEFDPFGNLIKKIDPRGHYQRMTYDAVGQLLEKRSYDGTDGTNATPLSVEKFSYEPGGLVAKATNALGGVTEKLYTSTGKLKYQKNPDGSETSVRYYLDGRVQREARLNGPYWDTIYDDANRLTTKILYSAAAVALATNITEVDRRGNVVRTVDEGGNSFTNFFDGLDRLKWSKGPMITYDLPPGIPGDPPPPVQQSVTNYYDAAGVVLTNINASGDKTITYFDALGRPTRTEIRSGADVLVRETTTGYAADHHSITVTNGSGTNAIVSTTFTDDENRPVLSIGYPNTNAREFTRQEYDPAGNLTFSGRYSQTNGVVTLWSQSTHTYDGLNRPSSTTDRDNAVTTFNYDAGNNLTNRVMPGGLKWRAEYNTAGQILKSFNLATDGTGTRTNLYTYYPTNVAFSGLLQTFTDGRGVVCTQAYDAFLRLATNTYSGSLPEHNSVTVRSYNTRGLLTNIVENFASTNTGAGTGVHRSYDAYGLLIGESVTINGVFQIGANQIWNSAGRRSAMSVGSFGQSFGWQADGQLTSAGGGAYTYTTAGLLASRNINGFSVNVTSRDGMGRILTQNSAVNSIARMSETLAWTGDGLLSAHTLAREDFTDSRSYDYVSLSRRLATERLNLTNGVAWTNVFGYDAGASGGAGVLTRMADPMSGGAEWTASMDLFNRIDHETNNVIRRMASGKMNATALLGTISLTLDGRPLPVNVLGTSDTNWPTEWRTVMELLPGPHTLQAVAKHSSGMFTTNKTVIFTNNAVDQTTLSHFAEGQLSYRIWKNSSGDTNRVQTFKWDSRSRLLATTELDSNNNGYDWSAIYDGLGRRLQTTTFIVTNGYSLTNQPKVISQSFDPSIEFLEVGVYISGKNTWKVYGPDLDGRYGGMNGTGGLEGTVDDLSIFRAVVSDARGNVHGTYDPVNGSMLWNASRPTGYGAVAEYRPTPLSENGNMGASSAWRGRWPDLSGLYWDGARYYDPVAGRFISCDPLGHDSDASLYAFAGGDPINYFDADGRLGIGTGKAVDFAWNLGVSAFLTPNVEGMTEEQRNFLSDLAIKQFGSPMQRIFGYEQSSTVTELPAQLGAPAQDAMMAYVGLRGGSSEPAPQPEIAWGAPMDPYVMRDSLPVYQLNTIPQQQKQPIVTVLGSAGDVAQYANKPGFNVLQMPTSIPRAQWDNYNRYWMMNAYTRGDSFWLATDPVKFSQTLQNANKSPNVSAYFRVELPILDSFNVRQNAVPAFNVPGGPPTILPKNP